MIPNKLYKWSLLVTFTFLIASTMSFVLIFAYAMQGDFVLMINYYGEAWFEASMLTVMMVSSIISTMGWMERRR